MGMRAIGMLTLAGLLASCGSDEGREEELSQEVARLQQENTALRKKADQPQSQDTESLNQRIEELLATNADLTARVAASENSNQRVAELNSIVETQRSELANLDRERQRLNTTLAELEKRRDELNAQLAAAEGRNTELATRLSALNSDLERVEAERQRIDAERTRVADELRRTESSLATTRDFVSGILKGYAGIWLAEIDEDAPLPNGCRIFLRIDVEPVAFSRVVACPNGNSQIDSFVAADLESRYHSEMATNALRFKLRSKETSCTTNTDFMSQSTALYLLHFQDGFGAARGAPTAALGEPENDVIFMNGNEVPELLRNAKCTAIQQRAAAASATPLLKLAAQACTASVGGPNAGCVEGVTL